MLTELDEYVKYFDFDAQPLYDRVIITLSKVKEVENYKAMCELLHEKDYSTHADLKKKQLEAWKICFSWKMNKRKFTRIKVYELEEYFANLMNKKYYNSALYSMCALLNWTGELTNRARLLTSKAELAVALGYFNREFQLAKYGKKDNLIEIEEKTLQKYGTNYSYLSSYKEQIKKKEDDTDITFTTKKAFQDFSSHQGRNISNQINSLLDYLQKEGIIVVNTAFIGGFMDLDFVIQNEIDPDLIYSRNGCFYYPTQDKTAPDLLIPYTDRELDMEEVTKYLNITGDAMVKLKCHGLSDVFKTNQKQAYNELVFQGVKRKLNAVFVYKALDIRFNQPILQYNKELYKKQNEELFTFAAIKKSLSTVNSEIKEQVLSNKERRQSKEISNNKNKLGNTVFQSKQEELINKQKLESYLTRNFNDSFININIDDYFPENCVTPQDFKKNQFLIWAKIIAKSKKKIDNYQLYEQQNRQHLNECSERTVRQSKEFLQKFMSQKQEILKDNPFLTLQELLQEDFNSLLDFLPNLLDYENDIEEDIENYFDNDLT